jgi:hypothetical protein
VEARTCALPCLNLQLGSKHWCTGGTSTASEAVGIIDVVPSPYQIGTLFFLCEDE